jgi:hypothetical protein
MELCRTTAVSASTRPPARADPGSRLSHALFEEQIAANGDEDDRHEVRRRRRRDEKGALRYLIGERAALASLWRVNGVVAEPQDGGALHYDAIVLIDRQVAWRCP